MTDPWDDSICTIYTYLREWDISMKDVGKYRPYMDPKGYRIRVFCWVPRKPQNTQITCHFDDVFSSQWLNVGLGWWFGFQGYLYVTIPFIRDPIGIQIHRAPNHQ